MTTEYMLQYMLFIPYRETNKHIKKKALKPDQNILSYVFPFCGNSEPE